MKGNQSIIFLLSIYAVNNQPKIMLNDSSLVHSEFTWILGLGEDEESDFLLKIQFRK